MPRLSLSTLRQRVQIRTRLVKVGNRVRCACCGATSFRFQPAGDPPRTHARCPHCGALERHRILWPYLSARIEQGDRVLHFGPEPVIARNLSGLSIDYVPADLNPEASHLAHHVVVRAADITQQPWPDSHFDVVIASHVLEHVEDDESALRELHRVLKPGGVAVIQVPNDPGRESTFEDPSVVSHEDRRRHFGQFDHVRVYGRDVMDRLTAPGFSVQVLYMGEPPGSRIYQASKPA